MHLHQPRAWAGGGSPGPQRDFGTGEEPVATPTPLSTRPLGAVPSGRVPPLKDPGHAPRPPGPRPPASELRGRPHPMTTPTAPQAPPASPEPRPQSPGRAAPRPSRTLAPPTRSPETPPLGTSPAEPVSEQPGGAWSWRRRGLEGAWPGAGRARAQRGPSVRQSVHALGRGPSPVHSRGRAAMDFPELAEAAERWCGRTPFQLIAAEETERRLDFYADPGVSFYVLCPLGGCGDHFVSARREGGRVRGSDSRALGDAAPPGDLRTLDRSAWVAVQPAAPRGALEARSIPGAVPGAAPRPAAAGACMPDPGCRGNPGPRPGGPHPAPPLCTQSLPVHAREATARGPSWCNCTPDLAGADLARQGQSDRQDRARVPGGTLGVPEQGERGSGKLGLQRVSGRGGRSLGAAWTRGAHHGPQM